MDSLAKLAATGKQKESTPRFKEPHSLKRVHADAMGIDVAVEKTAIARRLSAYFTIDLNIFDLVTSNVLRYLIGQRSTG